MTRKYKTHWLLTAIFVFFCINSICQTLPINSFPSGILKGSVSDYNDAVIGRAQILIVGNGASYKLQSNSIGAYEAALPAGTYQVIVEKQGFVKATYLDVEIIEGTDTLLTCKLHTPLINIDPSPDKPSGKLTPVPKWLWKQMRRVFG